MSGVKICCAKISEKDVFFGKERRFFEVFVFKRIS